MTYTKISLTDLIREMPQTVHDTFILEDWEKIFEKLFARGLKLNALAAMDSILSGESSNENYSFAKNPMLLFIIINRYNVSLDAFLEGAASATKVNFITELTETIISQWCLMRSRGTLFAFNFWHTKGCEFGPFTSNVNWICITKNGDDYRIVDDLRKIISGNMRFIKEKYTGLNKYYGLANIGRVTALVGDARVRMIDYFGKAVMACFETHPDVIKCVSEDFAWLLNNFSTNIREDKPRGNRFECFAGFVSDILVNVPNVISPARNGFLEAPARTWFDNANLNENFFVDVFASIKMELVKKEIEAVNPKEAILAAFQFVFEIAKELATV